MVSIPKFYYKENLNAKVAICIPVRDLVTSAFTHSLAMLTNKCGRDNKSITIHRNIGSEVAMQRQELVNTALDTDCTHILWLDSDMIFPTVIIEALMSHDKDIIACNYSTRVPPHRPVAFKTFGDLDKRVFSQTGIETVDAVGMGAMLVKRSVYEKIQKPHFGVEWNNDYTSLIGEDMFFCKKAAENGYEVWVDNDTSMQISHVGTTAFTIKGNCND